MHPPTILALATTLAAGAMSIGCAADWRDEATAATSQAIIGGTPVPAGELGAVVRVVKGIGGSSCTATIVAPTYLVTAAHCVTAAPAGQLIIVIGDAIHHDTEVHLHPGYGSEAAVVDDLAVVKFSPATEVAPIAIGRMHVPLGTEAMFAGYGYTSPRATPDDAEGAYGALHQYAEPIVSCRPWDDGTSRQLRDFRQLCIAQADGTGTCNGDSGGPALVRTDGVLRLAGVTSYGDALCREFGVATRVAWYADFIDTATEGSLPEAFTGDAAERETASGCRSTSVAWSPGAFWLSVFVLGRWLRRRRAVRLAVS